MTTINIIQEITKKALSVFGFRYGYETIEEPKINRIKSTGISYSPESVNQRMNGESRKREISAPCPTE